MKPKCKFCAALKENEDPKFDGYYRCSHGHFDVEDKHSPGRKIPQWFAWSGIWKPNKAVAKAQADCQDYQQHPKIKFIR